MSHTNWGDAVRSAAIDRDADVLVIGGGPAGAWAAIAAAANGSAVVLVDKGCCGTSGATAAAGTGIWYVEPDPARRLAAMESREKLGGYLQDRGWMRRVLDRTYEGVNLLAEWGYRRRGAVAPHQPAGTGLHAPHAQPGAQGGRSDHGS